MAKHAWVYEVSSGVMLDVMWPTGQLTMWTQVTWPYPKWYSWTPLIDLSPLTLANLLREYDAHWWVRSICTPTMKVHRTCRNVYSPHIAPGGQPKTPFFLLFIRACCQFFLLLRPAGFFHLPLLLLLPLPVPPLTTAVQVQLCRWWGEFRQHTHTLTHSHTAPGDALKRHSDAAGFKARRTHTPSHPHKQTHKHSRAPRQSLHPHAATHTLTRSWSNRSWTETVALCLPALLTWWFEESVIQVSVFISWWH